ncbi:MAG: phosphoenolpyruvate carboxykinase (ATP) [Bacteriovoracaceae bacterium]|jgi:phosphoenolpyruvate carboxykinase (ATP)|nr:phosphoenolpyruvate carboxykinase (ATP) [Bacteriovoracaceae bacterium]
MQELLKEIGLNDSITYHYNNSNSFYIEKCIKSYGGHLSKDGALLVETGAKTGRSADDRYIVKSQKTEDNVWWDNNLNPMSSEDFAGLKADVIEYLNTKEELFVTKRSVGADDQHNINALLVTPWPQHALFSTHMFRPSMRVFESEDFTILHAPNFKVKAGLYGAKNPTIVATCFETNTTIIVGTMYAGEIKKSMFSVMNYVLPESKVLPMHSGASKLSSGQSCVFFGLSGTGKTTLSTDEGMLLIGDDEHGLSDEGIFNFEGGCYAKTYKLSYETEPGIWDATNKFGSMIENVTFDKTNGQIDFNDKTLTENGRAAYPLEHIAQLEKSSRGQIPKNIFFLTADAFGVLPAVSKLTNEQAMFYFVLGYTAKLAGTEIGVKEPTATFSPCFGAPFMLRHPSQYAQLLGHYVKKYDINVWLINTGWSGGSYGVGNRFPLKVTRQIIRQVQKTSLDGVSMQKDEIFGLNIPTNIEGVDKDLLVPQNTWDDKEDYFQKAQKLAQDFHEQMKNFDSFYEENLKGAPSFGNNL